MSAQVEGFDEIFTDSDGTVLHKIYRNPALKYHGAFGGRVIAIFEMRALVSSLPQNKLEDHARQVAEENDWDYETALFHVERQKWITVTLGHLLVEDETEKA